MFSIKRTMTLTFGIQGPMDTSNIMERRDPAEAGSQDAQCVRSHQSFPLVIFLLSVWNCFLEFLNLSCNYSWLVYEIATFPPSPLHPERCKSLLFLKWGGQGLTYFGGSLPPESLFGFVSLPENLPPIPCLHLALEIVYGIVPRMNLCPHSSSYSCRNSCSYQNG